MKMLINNQFMKGLVKIEQQKPWNGTENTTYWNNDWMDSFKWT